MAVSTAPRKQKFFQQLDAGPEARQAQLAVLAKDYPARLMSALERASKSEEFEITVKSGVFEVYDLKSCETYHLTYFFGEGHTYNSLCSLEAAVALKETALAEIERRRTLRESAYNKLTQEEREELGL